MKVKTILNKSICTKYEIIKKLNEENYYSYEVDYLSKNLEPMKYDNFEKHLSIVTLPDNILAADIEHISINSASLALTIWIK